MKKKELNKQEVKLPYWPSQEFMTGAIKMAREKGFKGTDEVLKDTIIKAYRSKRIKILKQYEDEN